MLGKLPLVEPSKGQLIRSNRRLSPGTALGGDTLRQSLLHVLRICQGKEGDTGDSVNNGIFAWLAAMELDVLSGFLERYALRISHLELTIPENLIALLESRAKALRSLSSPIDLSLFSNPTIPLGLISFNAYRTLSEATWVTDGHDPSIAKPKETCGKNKSSEKTSLDVCAPEEPGIRFDILIELHEKEDEEKKMGGRSAKSGIDGSVSEGEELKELFSGILLFGGFWNSNADGLRVDGSQTELQELETVSLSPVLRSQVSTLTHMRLPVFTAKSRQYINSFWVHVKKPLNGVSDIEVRRNVKFLVKDFFQRH